MPPVAKPKYQLEKTFLRYWRRQMNLSQEAAASQLNISRGLLSQLENAKTPYTQRLIEQAAILYQCSPAEILVGPGLINIDLLKQSIEGVEFVCMRYNHQVSASEKAQMIVKSYRDAIEFSKTGRVQPDR